MTAGTMSLETDGSTGENSDIGVNPGVRSLRELVELVSGRRDNLHEVSEVSSLAESAPFPFFALVGQSDAKLALLLALVNPYVGGVLLLGPRGTGKTTSVRSLHSLLPETTRSACYYGCLPEEIEAGGIDAVCPDCAKKYGEGISLTVRGKLRIIELPLNASMEDVVGGLDEKSLVHARVRLKRGILAEADKNILFVDEINLLSNEIADSILDASAQGSYTVRRGAVSGTYRSRFTLIGSMNPEEGSLRPQILDRFGLRVFVPGLTEPSQRLEAYHRVKAYLNNPHCFIEQYAGETERARIEVMAARICLPEVRITDAVALAGVHLVQNLGIDSLRAEITLFEAARAYAAIDGRKDVKLEDLMRVAPISLCMRRSLFMGDFANQQHTEAEEISTRFNEIRAKVV